MSSAAGCPMSTHIQCHIQCHIQSQIRCHPQQIGIVAVAEKVGRTVCMLLRCCQKPCKICDSAGSVTSLNSEGSRTGPVLELIFHTTSYAMPRKCCFCYRVASVKVLLLSKRFLCQALSPAILWQCFPCHLDGSFH